MGIDVENSFLDLFDEWYSVKIEASNRSEETKKHYDNFRKIIKTHFDKNYNEIKPSYYQRAFNIICKSSGNGHAKRLNAVIKKVIEFAQADGVEIRDFTVGIEFFSKRDKKSREEKYLHSISDYYLLKEYLESRFNFERTNAPYYLWLGLLTALRPAELLGLRWENVDFEAKELRTDDRVSTTTLKRTTAKNRNSIRTIPISDEVVEVLQKMQMKQKEILEKSGLDNPENYVFLHPAYRYGLPTNSGLTMYLKTTLRTLKITPEISLYGLRHSRISYLLSQGVGIAVVARYCGHADISQIVATYGGLLDESRKTGFSEIQKL